MISKPDLWARIDALSLDDPQAAFAFSRRLARDNGWSVTFSRRVIREYKRFVYLSQVSDSPVTPSDEVDQVWHLHLSYTRHYWESMCDQVLSRPLHHGPTRGGVAEEERYIGCYQDTCALYLREFGEKPPKDIWPDTDVRFGEAPFFRRVNTAHAWIIVRPRWLDKLGQRTRAALCLAAGLTAASVAGASIASAQVFEGIDDDTWIIGLVVVCFAVVMFKQIVKDGSRKSRRRKRKGGSGAGGCGGCGYGDSDGGSGCGGGGCGGD